MSKHGPTLVDCDCQARVHGDGSGIEVDFCPLHDAALAMSLLLKEVAENGVMTVGRHDRITALLASIKTP